LKSCQFVKKGWLIAAVPNSMVGGINGINTPFLLKVNEGKAGNRESGLCILILNLGLLVQQINLFNLT
jgi:hypothetical protein